MPEALCFYPFPAVRIRTQPKTSTMSLSQYFGRCTYIAFCCGQRKHGKRIIVSLPGINLSRIVWSRFFGRARVTPRKSTPSPHANAKRSRSHRLSPEDIETQWSPNIAFAAVNWKAFRNKHRRMQVAPVWASCRKAHEHDQRKAREHDQRGPAS